MRRSTLLLIFACLLPASFASAQLVITEVYYCHGPVDDGFEWVELFNAGLGDFPLEGYVLAHGGNDYSWTVVTFGPDDVIPPCGTFVVGGPNSVAENAFPIFDKILDLDEDLQNGGVVADGVALFTPGADILTDTPIDAVLYGEVNSTGLLDENGVPGPPDVGNVPGYGVSIARTSASGDWVIEPAPNPNTTTFIPVLCEPIEAEVRSWGVLKSRFRN